MKLLLTIIFPFALFSQSEFLIPAKEAKIIAPYESRFIGESFEFWNHIETHLVWAIQVDKPIVVNIEIQQAYVDDNTAEYYFKVGEHKLKCKVLNTQSWTNFVYQKLGRIELPKGTHTITIKPINKPGLAIMNFKNIKLIGHNLEAIKIIPVEQIKPDTIPTPHRKDIPKKKLKYI